MLSLLLYHCRWYKYLPNHWHQLTSDSNNSTVCHRRQILLFNSAITLSKKLQEKISILLSCLRLGSIGPAAKFLTFGVEIERKYTTYLKILKYSYSNGNCKYIAVILKVYEYTSVLLLYFFPSLPFYKGKEFLWFRVCYPGSEHPSKKVSVFR